MTKLKVICGTKGQDVEYRMKKVEGYERMFKKALINAGESYELTSNFDTESRKKLFFSGVKFVNSLSFNNEDTREVIFDRFQLIEYINSTASELSPKDIQEIFPIEKRYDGARYEMKDYFYTKRFIEEFGEVQPIQNVFEFLWDYQNIELKIYLIKYLKLLSAIRSAEGNQGIAEEFFKEQGIPTYSLSQGANGKRYLVSSNGQISIVKKTRPRYLKVIK